MNDTLLVQRGADIKDVLCAKLSTSHYCGANCELLDIPHSLIIRSSQIHQEKKTWLVILPIPPTALYSRDET